MQLGEAERAGAARGRSELPPAAAAPLLAPAAAAAAAPPRSSDGAKARPATGEYAVCAVCTMLAELIALCGPAKPVAMRKYGESMYLASTNCSSRSLPPDTHCARGACATPGARFHPHPPPSSPVECSAAWIADDCASSVRSTSRLIIVACASVYGTWENLGWFFSSAASAVLYLESVVA